MGKSKPNKGPAVKEQTQAVAAQQADASVYSREELMAAAQSVFGVRPEIVAGAFRLKGKDAMTRAEAEAAIREFLRREV